MTLFDEEYNVLDKIARKSKMDCWFLIKQGKHDGEYMYDYVFDLEENKRMSLRQGVKQLIDGCIDLNINELTDDEKFTLIKLLGDLI